MEEGGYVIKEGRVEVEYGLAIASAEVGRPAGKELSGFQPFVKLHIPREVYQRVVGVLKVITDLRTVGWGEGAGGAASTVIREVFATARMSQDPENREGPWQRIFSLLRRGNVVARYGGSAISAVDVARRRERPRGASTWELEGRPHALNRKVLFRARRQTRVRTTLSVVVSIQWLS